MSSATVRGRAWCLVVVGRGAGGGIGALELGGQLLQLLEALGGVRCEYMPVLRAHQVGQESGQHLIERLLGGGAVDGECVGSLGILHCRQ